MLLKNNSKVYYKKETFNIPVFLFKFLLSMLILAISLGLIFFQPFLQVNHKAFSLASDPQFVKQRIDYIDSKKNKINKGDNFLTYDAQFFWNKNSSMVEHTNGYQKKFSNILMQYDKNSDNILVSIKQVPDISCAAFSDYIRKKHGNVIIEDFRGQRVTCPAFISSFLGNNKYTLTYTIK